MSSLRDLRVIRPMTPYSWAKSYDCFWGTGFYFLDRGTRTFLRLRFLALTTEAAGSSETSVTCNRITLLQVSEDSYLHSYFYLPPPQSSLNSFSPSDRPHRNVRHGYANTTHFSVWVFNKQVYMCTMADRSGRAVWGMKFLRSLEHWDCEFESHSRHGCLCAFILCLCCR
jgi:hypothetical protein